MKPARQHLPENLTDNNRKMRSITNIGGSWTYSNMPRRWETALCRLRIGYTRITYSYIIAHNQNTFSEDCIVPLTVRHLL